MLITHEGKSPIIGEGSRVAPTAVVCGDVEIGRNVSIGFGAVVVAEGGSVRIGDNCVIMDTAVLRGVKNAPLTLGRNILVGPRAHLSGCTVEDEVFLATGATVFNGAVIGAGAQVRINGTVHLRTYLPAGATVPVGWIAVGNPARILPPDRHDEIWAIQKPLNFPKHVFGVERPPEGGNIMQETMTTYAAALVRRHAKDQVLE